ncbi:MAG: hypothetical protein ABF289_00300, partial [Clostridiales bacterium]
MIYIDYIEYLQSKFYNKVFMDEKLEEFRLEESNIDSKHFKFTDILSNTNYFVDIDKAKEITNNVIDYINKEMKDKNINEILDFIYGVIIDRLNEYEYKKFREENIKFKLALLGKLPYINNDDLKNKNFTKYKENFYRISDFISIRTGILYAIKPNFNDKEHIRVFGLLDSINCYSEFNTIDLNTLISKEINFKYEFAELNKLMIKENSNYSKLKVDLVRGAQVKIKKYYLETDKLKSIRGASIILDDINKGKIKNYFRENYLEESIVYQGGGSFLAIVPEGKGKEVTEWFEKTHEDFTITAQSIATYRNIEIGDLICEYEFIMDKLMNDFNQRQMSKVYWNTDSNERNEGEIRNILA